MYIHLSTSLHRFICTRRVTTPTHYSYYYYYICYRYYWYYYYYYYYYYYCWWYYYYLFDRIVLTLLAGISQSAPEHLCAFILRT